MMTLNSKPHCPTPEIYIPDVAPGDLTLNFYSSWKRGNSHYGQVIVTYGDGTPVGPNLAGNDNWLAGTGKRAIGIRKSKH